MKELIQIFLVGIICASCTHVRPTDTNPSLAVFEFDLLEDADLVTSVDLIVLKGWTNHDPLGAVIDSKTLVVAGAKCEIDSMIRNCKAWSHDAFSELFIDFDQKQKYEGCFCAPKYVLAAVFYVQTDECMDPFGDDGKKVNNKVAVVLLDESHDSVLVSDMKHGPRHFRFSVGHSADSRTPQFIASVMQKLGREYEFLKD